MTKKPLYIITLLLLLSTFSICGCSKPIKPKIQPSNSNLVGLKREVDVLNILNNNLSWNFGKSASWYKWATPEDARNAFNQLTESDIPILIRLIQKNEIGDAQVNLSVWIISIFGDKAKIQVIKAYESATSADEKEKWKSLLEFIESNNSN